MIGIIGAMDSEVNELKANIRDVKIETFSGIEFYSGRINDKNVVVAKCGIGKVYAAVCAEIMILKYKVDQIIHIGIAGALDKDLKIGDVVIASDVVQYDVDQTFLGFPIGVVQGIDIANIPCAKELVDELEKVVKELNIRYKIGTIASGDKFLSSSADKKQLIERFNAQAVEMEGASTGQVCYINKVDFAVLRVMSDGGDENSDEDYNKNKAEMSTRSLRIILKFLNN